MAHSWRSHLLVLSLRSMAHEWRSIQVALSYRPEWKESCTMKKTMTQRERIQWANANDAHYAALSGKPAKYQQVVPAARAATVKSDPDELEGAVMKEVSSILRTHPKIVFAVRVNSGGAWMPSKGGKDAPVQFYRIVRQPRMTDVTIVDFTGWYYDDLVVRPFGFECKRRDWKFTGTPRELKQSSYLKMISAFGGIGSFITDGQQVHNLLEGKFLDGGVR